MKNFITNLTANCALMAVVVTASWLIGCENPYTSSETPVNYADGSVSAVQIPTGTYTISAGGNYKLPDAPASAQTSITLSTTAPVTIIGDGVPDAPPAWSGSNGIAINCTQPGTNLTIMNVWIGQGTSQSHLINFTGTGNTITIAGENLLEDPDNMGPGIFCVPVTADLTIKGSGTLYFYKNSQSAGIGGASGGANGSITFDGPTIFGKGTKEGAVIGCGANSGSTVPGDITFISGEYTLIGVARGAIIGGSAGAESTGDGGNIYIKGGTLNLNEDFTGAAIGGGGYKTNDDFGNDKPGGNVFFSGGSVRVFLDENAVNPNGNGSSYPWTVRDENGNPVVPTETIIQRGVNASGITAKRRNENGAYVYLFTFDTTKVAPDELYNVSIEGKQFYSGGKHKYRYINEDYYKYDSRTIPVTYTKENWAPIPDGVENNLYFFLTGTNHTLTVNGQSFTVVWDDDSKSFTY